MTHHETISTSALPDFRRIAVLIAEAIQRCLLKTPTDAGRTSSRNAAFH
jgi:hypothetical protein